MDKPAVVVLFGGRSSEHSISSVTAGGILSAIDRDAYRVIPIGITREGAFVAEADDPDRFTLNGAELPEVADNGTRILWPEPQGTRELRVVYPDGSVDSLGPIDVVLPVLHGLHGEDGSLQGFFDTLEVPYAGAGLLDSAISMDKHFMKVALHGAKIPVADWITVTKNQWLNDAPSVCARVEAMGVPLFVKPARAGSSVGVSKVHEIGELADAMSGALAEDSKVLIEVGVVGREFEVAILETRTGVEASVPGEIVFHGREFYDFEGKYLGGEGVEVVCPADIDAELARRIQDMGLRAFHAVDGRGLARVDTFVTPDGEIVVNELNTMPGFTPISMYPKCWIASGLSYRDLITEIIEVGRAR